MQPVIIVRPPSPRTIAASGSCCWHTSLRAVRPVSLQLPLGRPRQRSLLALPSALQPIQVLHLPEQQHQGPLRAGLHAGHLAVDAGVHRRAARRRQGGGLVARLPTRGGCRCGRPSKLGRAAAAEWHLHTHSDLFTLAACSGDGNACAYIEHAEWQPGCTSPVHGPTLSRYPVGAPPYPPTGGFGPKLESWAFGVDQDGLEALLREGVFQLRTCKLCDDGVVVKVCVGGGGWGGGTSPPAGAAGLPGMCRPGRGTLCPAAHAARETQAPVVAAHARQACAPA